MSESHLDFWRKNIDGKIKELQDLCYAFCTSEIPKNTTAQEFRNLQCKGIHKAIENLNQLFAVGQRPRQLSALKSQCDTFLTNRNNNEIFHKFLSTVNSLPEITSGLQKLVSFHDIFESYKNDAELNELVDRLISTLESVLEEGHENLNSRIERELQRILDQLKERSKYSLYELAAWVEIAGRFAAELCGQKFGIPGTSLLVDAAKIVTKISKKIVNSHRSASAEVIRLIEVQTIANIPNESIPLTEEEILKLERMSLQGTLKDKIVGT